MYQVEGHGDASDEEVRGGERGDGVVGGLANPSIHNEGEEDQNVAKNCGQDADDHEKCDRYGLPCFKGWKNWGCWVGCIAKQSARVVGWC